jgi:hypothetical protein
MDAIETNSIERDGQIFRIAIYPDGDAPNPLEEWDEMGTILSLNRRHRNFDSAGVEEAIEHNPDAVPLSYFDHGRCQWAVAGELPPGARCPWDSVAVAGVWLPDAGTLESAQRYGGRTRRQFMRIRARQACLAYTQWCNGGVFGYEIRRLVVCGKCRGEGSEPVDSCWGFFGIDACRAAAGLAMAGS